MVSTFSAVFPPSPSLTEKNLAAQNGKVFIVTGAASGVGFELAKILYVAGGTVYVTARSDARCGGAIEQIKEQAIGLKTKGVLKSMVLDLADLSTVKPAVDGFLKQGSRLDILFNNAGVMNSPLGSKGKQGQDLEMATNCLGPYLLTKLLEPILIQTAASSPQFSVRVVFVVALLQFWSPKVGMEFNGDGSPKILPGDNYMKPQPGENYMQSKLGGVWMAADVASRLGSKGIFSTSVHPGLMRTELQRNMPVSARVSMKLLFKSPIYGAYSELFCGFSPQLKSENNGGYVLPWGRIAELTKYASDGLKSEAEGGTGGSKMFLDYCERQMASFR